MPGQHLHGPSACRRLGMVDSRDMVAQQSLASNRVSSIDEQVTKSLNDRADYYVLVAAKLSEDGKCFAVKWHGGSEFALFCKHVGQIGRGPSHLLTLIAEQSPADGK